MELLRLEKSIEIKRPADRLYAFLHNVRNLPRLLAGIESVTPLYDKKTLWSARGKNGEAAFWTAEITSDRPNELLSWRSSEGSEIEIVGSVQFKPLEAGSTLLTVTLACQPAHEDMAGRFSHLFGAAGERLERDLQAFKVMMESLGNTDQAIIEAA